LVSIASLVAIGSSFEECENKIRKLAETIHGYALNIDLPVIERLKEKIEKAKKLGFSF